MINPVEWIIIFGVPVLVDIISLLIFGKHYPDLIVGWLTK